MFVNLSVSDILRNGDELHFKQDTNTLLTIKKYNVVDVHSLDTVKEITSFVINVDNENISFIVLYWTDYKKARVWYKKLKGLI